MRDMIDYSPIYDLIYEDNVEELQRYFARYAIDIDYVTQNDDYGNENSTLLCFAVQESKIKCTEFLLQNNANIRYVDTFGMSAIHIAVLQENIEIIKLLIAYGADINFCNYEGETPLLIALRCGYINLSIFIDLGMDIFIKNHENLTALHIASQSGDVKSVTILIERGLDIHDSDNKMLATPLHYAAMNCQFEVIDILIKAGADIEARDVLGNTPLLLACNAAYTWKDKTIKSVQALIQAGADIHAFNHNNLTALQLAVSFGLSSSVQALMQARTHTSFSSL